MDVISRGLGIVYAFNNVNVERKNVSRFRLVWFLFLFLRFWNFFF